MPEKFRKIYDLRFTLQKAVTCFSSEIQGDTALSVSGSFRLGSSRGVDMNRGSVQRMGKRIPWRPMQKKQAGNTLGKAILRLLARTNPCSAGPG